MVNTHSQIRNIIVQISIATFVLLFSTYPWGPGSLIGVPFAIILIWKKHSTINNEICLILFALFFNLGPFLFFSCAGAVSILAGSSHLTSGAGRCEGQNLRRKSRLYPSQRAWIPSGIGEMHFSAVNLGKFAMASIVGPGPLSHQGAYPTLDEAKSLLICGQSDAANDIDVLSKSLKIHPTTTKAIVNNGGGMHCDAGIIGRHPDDIYFTKRKLYQSEERSVRWASCGKHCLVISPMVHSTRPLMWSDPGRHIFLVNTEKSVVFARYRIDKYPELFKALYK